MFNEKDLFGDEWHEKLLPLFKSDYWKWLKNFLAYEWSNNEIIPNRNSTDLFKVFRVTPPDKLSVVILGKNPFQAYIDKPHTTVYDGLAYSNNNSFTLSPSLRNIFKEIERCYDVPIAIQDMNLSKWSNQGVLLLNTVHSVVNKATQADIDRHAKAWENFTKYILQVINTKNDVIWILLGNYLSPYESNVTNKTHKVFKYGHPDPANTSNSFVGSCAFMEINRELKLKGIPEIIWG